MMFDAIRKTRFVSVFLAVMVFALAVGTVYAETKSDSVWARSTFTSGSSVLSQTYSVSGSKYYLDTNLRAWGQSPNPLKEEDQRYCYNCTSTSHADVSTVYYGAKVARHLMVVYLGATNTYDYTSQTGGTSSNSGCWSSGIVYC